MPFLSKSELRNLIGKDKTQQVIDDLLEITKSLEDNELHNEVVLQSSKFKKYQKRGRKGISTFENQDISISRIEDALIQIIDNLPNDLKKTPTEIELKQKKKSIWTYVVLLTVLLAVLLVIAILIRFIFTENHQHKPDFTTIPTNFATSSNSIFKANNTDTFNVLIVRFEDYIVGEDTYCIGRAVEEHLNVIDVNENLSLPLKNVYVADSIMPPKNQQEAIAIQKRHHSDLIIYGLARQVEQNCAGAEVCFRYKIAEKVIANVAPENKVKAAKHDAEYQQTSPIEIEDGKLQIDSLSIKYWISSLVNAKANKIEKTFEDLTDWATKDIELLSDSEKAIRYFTVGNTYIELMEFQKAVSNFDKAIQFDPDYVLAYYNRGITYRDLKDYQKAIADFDKVIQLDPDYALAYINRGITYDNLKAHQKAINDLEKSKEFLPKNSWLYTTLACYYAAQNQEELALQNLEKAIQLGYDDFEELEEESTLASIRQLPRFKELISAIKEQ